MGRRKITEEAEKKKEEQQEQEEEETATDDSSSSDGRDQLTQRMPTDLVEEVDDWADAHGMSRNAAINFLVRESLPDE